MTLPDFDELIGSDVPTDERDRLRRAHDALVAAGPPPELTPALAHPPRMSRSPRGRPSPRPRLAFALPLAAAFLLAAFGAGYALRGDGREGFETVRELELRATGADRDAAGVLRVGARDEGGNFPMAVEVENLPILPPGGYYEVVLVRNGERIGPCGSFDVGRGRTEVYLNAPYDIRPTDDWIVVVHREEHEENPAEVMST